MAELFSVSVKEIIEENDLELLYTPKNPEDILVYDNDVNRPGLQLMGFYEYFNAERIQICGNMEFAYLASLEADVRRSRIETLFKTKIPLFVVARGLRYIPR